MEESYIDKNYISREPDLLEVTEVREDLKKQLMSLGNKALKKIEKIKSDSEEDKKYDYDQSML
jgi:hypothetical protein